MLKNEINMSASKKKKNCAKHKDWKIFLIKSGAAISKLSTSCFSFLLALCLCSTSFSTDSKNHLLTVLHFIS